MEMLTQIEASQNPFRLGNYWILWRMILNTPKVQCSKFICRFKSFIGDAKLPVQYSNWQVLDKDLISHFKSCIIHRLNGFMCVALSPGHFLSSLICRAKKGTHFHFLFQAPMLQHNMQTLFHLELVLLSYAVFKPGVFTTSNLARLVGTQCLKKPVCFLIHLCFLCQAAMAELIAMTLFVIIGCGAACANGASNSSNRLQVALAFGMGILVLAYSIGHHSGGQINCAVTLSLVLGGQVPWYQGLANLVAQLLGSLLGAGLLCGVFPCEVDATKSVGTNIIDDRWGVGSVLLGEFLGTFILCYVVWETAVSPLASCGKNACIAIGFAVFLAHVILLPVDGCSINPTRSFGPAIVGIIRNCDGMSTKGLEEMGQKSGKGGQRRSKKKNICLVMGCDG